MGIYFNPNNESFTKDTHNEIYIDKTGLLAELNKLIGGSNNCVAVSHARRFGKSQAAGMVDAYYSLGSDSRELFSKFEIAKNPEFEKYLNKYNVIHIDVSSFADYYKENLVEAIIKSLVQEFKTEVSMDIDYSRAMHQILMDIYGRTGISFIIIIDEWDCVVRNYADRPDLVHEYLHFLHSLFKSEEAKKFLALAYITGILPIKKIENESALNNFREYTMLDSKNLTTYFGFTQSEVLSLCEKYDMSFESVKEWYNGYKIGSEDMYNPNSVYQAMVDRKLGSYWKNTSAFSTINKYITLNYDGLKDDIIKILSGKRVKVDVESFGNDLSFINSRDEALTALIHLGYLGYDSVREQAYLPNYEVGVAYKAALVTGNWKEIAGTISKCEELLWATIDKEEERVAELIELAHESYSSIIKYNDENSVSSILQLAYFTAPAYYNVIRELPTGKGFADFAFIPRSDSGDKPAMIIEVKWDKNADSAIRQIKEKRYAESLKGYGKEVLLVGINYDRDKKQHICRIETVCDII